MDSLLSAQEMEDRHIEARLRCTTSGYQHWKSMVFFPSMQMGFTGFQEIVVLGLELFVDAPFGGVNDGSRWIQQWLAGEPGLVATLERCGYFGPGVTHICQG